jgi:hypothetical protein
MYEWESKGRGNLSFNTLLSPLNGFAVGKRYMEVTVVMWKTDIKAGLLFEQEIYSEKIFPTWCLKEIFSRNIHE